MFINVQNDWAASSRKSPGGSKVLRLRLMEVTVLVGTFNAAEFFFTDLYRDAILFQRSTDNSLDFMAWIVLWHVSFQSSPII